MIYLNYAATSGRRPECVANAVADSVLRSGSAGRGSSESDLGPARTVYMARKNIAELFGFRNPERVVFCANATQALNTAILGILSPGDHVIATDWDHNSVLRPLYRLRNEGVGVTFIGADDRGCLELKDIEKSITAKTRMLICTHASNVTGYVADISALSSIARKHGLVFLVDAAQTAGFIPIDMDSMCIDVLCFTGHKSLMGPTGTGGLCIREGVEIRPLMTGGTGVQSLLEEQPEAYPEHLEAGTLNINGISGLAAAVGYIGKTGIDIIRDHEISLTERFYEGIRGIQDIRIYGDIENTLKNRTQTPVMSINFTDVPTDEIGDILANEYDISVRTGMHCAPRMHRALGTGETGTVRFSFGHFTTEDEIDAAVNALRDISVRIHGGL